MLGIIPARAGNRFCRLIQAPHPGDHPRACGEQAIIDGFENDYEGSSPRVRGTATPCVARIFRRGIIPARAGNRWPRGHGAHVWWDHPRACGEQYELS